MLGKWTDELGKDNYMKGWFSTGPESYYCLTNTEKEAVKKRVYLKLQKLRTPKLKNHA